MSSTDRRAGGTQLDDEARIVGAAALLFAAGLAVVNFAVRVGALLGGPAQEISSNPIAVPMNLASGEIVWTREATWSLGLLGVVCIAAGVAIARLVSKRRAKRTRIDRGARQMTRTSELVSLMRAASLKKAARLGVSGHPGLPIGRNLKGRAMLYSSWEDVAIDIWGPRTGKTTSRAIPAIMAAPGAVVATSNKRDLVDGTRGVRELEGPVWVFDPQGIVDEPPTWWWNPLSYVTDETKATILANVLAAAGTSENAKTDAFFEPAGRELVGNLLLAAAVSGLPITQVYRWLSRPTDVEPIEILDSAGYELQAESLKGAIYAPDKQRAGVFGSGQRVCSFLTNNAATEWVVPPRDGSRPEFDPHQFVKGTATLYSLSKEGAGTAGPLVTALTMAVCEAAEDLAKTCPLGRLPKPMVAVLDEAANVCRWKDLPNLYSHYGSRGICIMTILQSWSQGVEVWGRDGMKKLWSAANVKVYGGGVSEVEFLGELSQLVGEYEQRTVSTSSGGGRGAGRNVQRASRTQRVLDVADLGAMPRGRALLVASGVPPTLIQTVPWMDGEHADAIERSFDRYDPGRRTERADAVVAIDGLGSIPR